MFVSFLLLSPDVLSEYKISTNTELKQLISFLKRTEKNFDIRFVSLLVNRATK